MPGEWVEWHARYASEPGRAARLRLVQQILRSAWDTAPPGPIRLLSLCAGDGRDVVGALEGHPRAPDVRAWLVESDPDLVAAGREQAAAVGLTGVTFLLGDAARPATYAALAPFDLVLACGIFGNIPDEDVQRTVEYLPALCRPGALAVWTRGRFPPDLTPAIRRWFAGAGFREVTFASVPQTTAAVGAARFEGGSTPRAPVDRLFTFLPPEQRPSARASRSS